MARLVCVSVCKRVAKDLADKHRAHKFTRVADSFVDECEAKLLNIMTEKIKRLPSMGKTIK